MSYPSNKLYGGECSGIEEAFTLVIAELNYERRLAQKEDVNDPFVDHMMAEINTIQALRSEYLERVNAVRNALMHEWMGKSEWGKLFAESYFRGDYSSLAI